MAGPVDVDARIAANHRLSDAYNILELEAPEIARQTRPGQFVMVKRALGREPLLRRPFSVFEVLRDTGGAATGLSLLSKQVGAVTRDLYRAEPGERLRCLGPLGVPFSVVGPPTRAAMVAGGVGLGPRSPRWPRRCGRAASTPRCSTEDDRATICIGSRSSSASGFVSW